MLRCLFITAFVLAAGVIADKAPTVIPPPHPPQPTAAPSTSTTLKPTSKPTTTSTTSAPTTTPAPTTTHAPSTTTLAPPTPTPNIKPGIWNVTEANNKTVACVVATMFVNIVIPYVKADPKNATIHTNTSQEITVPAHASATGNCGNTTQSLTLSWKVANASLSLSFVFEKNNKSEFTMSSINASIPATKSLFPDIVANTTEFKLTSLNASAPIPLHQSYLCAAGVNFTLADSTHKNATPIVPALILEHVQFQAFANIKENKFDTAVDCAAVPYVTPDIVPIAVGVSLAALVAVVLVAYVIGRRRSAARGYLSM